MGKVTISDVAREAGVALGTVSNALNHPEKVKAETLRAVNDAIRRLGYAPNQSARLLAGGRNPTFGLVLPRLNHGLSLQIANGASVEASRRGYGLLIATAQSDTKLEDTYTHYFLGTQMSGILVQTVGEDSPSPAASAGAIPMAYLDAQSSSAGYYVAADNRAQGALIASHAISIHASSIAVIGSAQPPHNARRLEGIFQTMELHPEIDLEVIEEGDPDLAADGYALGKDIAKRPAARRPDAVIGLTDVLATGAIAGILSEGLCVPQDIAVAGCDGNPLAWTGTVPLTTCAPTGYEIGRRGIHCLIDQIEAARSGLDRSQANGDNHQELVRPFMLMRTSTTGETAMQQNDIMGLNLGTYL